MASHALIAHSACSFVFVGMVACRVYLIVYTASGESYVCLTVVEVEVTDDDKWGFEPTQSLLNCSNSAPEHSQKISVLLSR